MSHLTVSEVGRAKRGEVSHVKGSREEIGEMREKVSHVTVSVVGRAKREEVSHVAVSGRARGEGVTCNGFCGQG